MFGDASGGPSTPGRRNWRSGRAGHGGHPSCCMPRPTQYVKARTGRCCAALAKIGLRMQSTIAYTCPVGARARSLRQSNIPKHISRAELARIFAVLGGALHSRRRGGICVDLHHQMVCSDMEQRDKLFCIAKHEAAPTTSSARSGSASHAARVRWPFWRCWKAIGSGCSPAVEEAAREQYAERVEGRSLD